MGLWIHERDESRNYHPLGWAFKLPCKIWQIEDKNLRWKTISLAKYYFESPGTPGQLVRVDDSIRAYSFVGRGIPKNGFVVSEFFEQFGGPDALAKMCEECPISYDSKVIASCTGSIPYDKLWLKSGNIPSLLDKILSELNLTETYDLLFPETNPRWYGFWVESPLPLKKLQIIRAVFTRLLEEYRLAPKTRKSTIGNTEMFIDAMNTAEKLGYPLHVAFGPPYYPATCGPEYDSAKAHCPRCRAEPELANGFRDTVRPYECKICGTWYEPGNTTFFNLIPELDDLFDLNTQLGGPAYKIVVIKYLMATGSTEEKAISTFESHQEAEQKNRTKVSRLQFYRQSGKLFAEKVLFQGLEAQPPSKGGQPLRFKPEAFLEILNRCSISHPRGYHT